MTTEADRALELQKAAQTLADAIGPRRPWVLVLSGDSGELLVYTALRPEEARDLTRRYTREARP